MHTSRPLKFFSKFMRFIIKIMDEVTIITTQRGGLAALHKGYRYHKHHNLQKDNRIRWRCVFRHHSIRC